jgi:hypothetical protein
MAASATDRSPDAGIAHSAVAPGRRFGLYDAASFRLTDGRGTDGPTPRTARWYFEHETIAVPLPERPLAGLMHGVRAADDIRAWAASRQAAAAIDWPPLVWAAAPDVVEGAHLAQDASTLTLQDGRTVAFRLVAKHPLNRSYFDASSARFLAQRTLRVRGTQDGDALVARTLWPEDFAFGPALPADKALPRGPVDQALRTVMRAEPCGGAQSPYAASTLWRREGIAAGTTLTPGTPVLGLMVNGAQGDDDEAHGGHFALVTGRVAADGAIGDWLVNNFYSLDIESEKGILAAPVPLDNYLADLNSGQGWYRPTHMLLAVLSDERAAALTQSALARVYLQFYRHQLVYQHSTMNCASISVDVLRALGWALPARGPAGRAAGWLAFPYFLAKERSLAKARTAVDYLIEDQTRLMPAAAFEVAGEALLQLAGARDADGVEGTLPRMLAADVDAIAFLRFPQWPSSRAFGDAPAVTPWEYRARIPRDPAKVQVVPVPPRPFPARLRDPDLLPLPRRPSDAVAATWSLVAMLAVVLATWWLLRF